MRNRTRRDFVKTTARAGGALGALGALGPLACAVPGDGDMSAADMAPPDPQRILILGGTRVIGDPKWSPATTSARKAAATMWNSVRPPGVPNRKPAQRCAVLSYLPGEQVRYTEACHGERRSTTLCGVLRPVIVALLSFLCGPVVQSDQSIEISIRVS